MPEALPALIPFREGVGQADSTSAMFTWMFLCERLVDLLFSVEGPSNAEAQHDPAAPVAPEDDT